MSRFNHSVNHDNRNYNLDLSRFHYGKQKIHVIITIKSVGTMYRIIVGSKITITGPVATVYPTIVGNKNSIIVPEGTVYLIAIGNRSITKKQAPASRNSGGGGGSRGTSSSGSSSSSSPSVSSKSSLNDYTRNQINWVVTK